MAFQDLIVRVGADVAGFKDAFRDATEALEKAGDRANKAGGAISRAFENLGVSDAGAKVAAQAKSIEASFALLEKAYADGKITADDFAKAQEGVRRQIEALGQTKVNVDQFERLGDSLKALGVDKSKFQIDAEIQRLQGHMATLEKAFHAGKISSDEFGHAQANLKKQIDGLTSVPVEKFDRIGEALKAIKVDKSQFDIDTKIAELQKNLDYLDRAFKAGKLSAADYALAQKSVREQLDKLASTKLPVEDVAKLNAAFKTLGIDKSAFQIDRQVEDLRAGLATLEKAFKAGTISAADFAKAQKAVEVELSKLTKVPVETFAEKLKKLDAAGNQLRDVGGVLTAAFTLPIAGAGLAVTKFAADFDSAMRNVTSLLGGVSDTEFKKLSDATLEMSRRIGVDAVQSAKALYEALSAGVPKENAISFVEVASKTAIAGLTDAKVAVDALTTIIEAYSLKTSDAKAVSDSMFSAVKIGKFQFDDLAKAIGPAAQQASNLGVSYQELLAATGTLSVTSGGVSEAVTQIESAMRALLDPTKEMKAALEAIGFQSGSAAVKALGLEGTLEALRKQSHGNAEAFNAMFGRIEAANGALGLTGDKAKKAAGDLDIMRRAQDGLGESTLAFNERNKATTRQFEIALAEAKNLAIEFGASLLPAVNDLLKASKPLVETVQDLVKWFVTLPEPVRNTALAVVAATAAAGPFAFTLGSIASGLATLGKLFSSGGLLSGLGLFGSSADAAGKSLAAMSIASTGAAGTGGILFNALSKVPGVLSSIGKSALDAFVLFPSRIPGATAAVSSLWAALTQVPGALASIASAGAGAFTGIISQIGRLADATKALALASLATLTGSIANVVFAVQNNLVGALSVGEKALLALGQAALIAGSAFVGWKVGAAMYENIAWVQRFGDAVADLILKVPGAQFLLEKMSGASGALARAQSEATVTTKRLEDALKSKGIVIDRAGKSADEYARALFEAATKAGVATGALEKAFDTLGVTSKEKLLKNLEAAKAAFATVDKAFREGKASADDLAKAKKALADAANAATGAGKKLTDQQTALKEAVDKAKTAYEGVVRAYLAGKASTEELERAQLKLRAAQDAADPTRVLERSAKAWEETYNRIDKQIADYIAAVQKLDEVNKQVEKSNLDLAVTFGKAHEAMRQASLEVEKITVPLEKRIPPAVQEAVRATKELEAAMGRVGGKTVEELDRMAERARKDYELITASGKASPEAILRAEVEYVRASIEARRAHGETITKEEEARLGKLEDQLGKHTKKQASQWEGLMRQVSTIATDLSKDIAEAITGIFRGNSDNDRILQEQADLRASLEARRQEWTDYQADVALKLEALRAKHADELAGQEADLQRTLDEKRADYDEYVADTTAKIGAIREKHAEELAGEVADLMDAQREKEIEYGEYQDEIIARIAEVRQAHAEQLEEELDDLRDNLRDKTQQYEDFVSDVETKLGRLKVDTADDIQDETRSTNRKIADRQKDFKREEEDTRKKIARLRAEGKKGNEQEIADLEKSLQRKREDTQEYIRREQEDLQDFIEEKRRRQAQEEQDLRESLDRKTRDHQEYIRENSEREAEITEKHRKAVADQVADLQASLDKRGDALLKFRNETEEKIAAITLKHQQAQDKEIADLQAGLAKRTAEWEKYKIDAIAKLEAIQAKAKIELEADEAKLAADLAKAQSDFDKYVNATNSKLAELEAQFKGVWDRIGDGFEDMLGSMGEALIRFGVEYLEGKLFKWLKGDLLDDILPKLAKVFKDIFTNAASGGLPTISGIPGGTNNPTGPIDTRTPGPPGGGIPGGGGAGSVAGVLGKINVATGIISAVADVFTAIGTIRLEGTMNAVEENTRYGMIHTLFILNHVNEYLPKLEDIRSYLVGTFHTGFVELLSTSSATGDAILRWLSAQTDASSRPIEIAGFGESETLSGLFAAMTTDLIDTIRPMAAQIGQITEMLRGYSPSVLRRFDESGQPVQIQAAIGGDAFAGIAEGLKSVTAALMNLAQGNNQPVPVQNLQGATQWLAEIRNSLYYFVGLPWPELIRGVLGWDSGRPLTAASAPTVASAGTATLDIAPLVSAVSGSGKEVSGGLTALREAFLGFAGDNIGSLADLRGRIGRITDPLADIRGMVREFTSLPWRPALDKVASRTHQTMLVLELDGRELARGIVDDITSEQVLRLKLSGQAVF
jgi:TP901 family phage tail tape measure protein